MVLLRDKIVHQPILGCFDGKPFGKGNQGDGEMTSKITGHRGIYFGISTRQWFIDLP